MIRFVLLLSGGERQIHFRPDGTPRVSKMLLGVWQGVFYSYVV